jgi:hypothetical protein
MPIRRWKRRGETPVVERGREEERWTPDQGGGRREEGGEGK